MTDIAERVKRIIAEHLRLSAADLKSEDNFLNHLGADSLDLVEMVMEVESEFDIDIPDGEAEKIKTVRQAIAYVEQRKS
jgi:acyl carrier protein